MAEDTNKLTSEQLDQVNGGSCIEDFCNTYKDVIDKVGKAAKNSNDFIQGIHHLNGGIVFTYKEYLKEYYQKNYSRKN